MARPSFGVAMATLQFRFKLYVCMYTALVTHQYVMQMGWSFICMNLRCGNRLKIGIGPNMQATLIILLGIHCYVHSIMIFIIRVKITIIKNYVKMTFLSAFRSSSESRLCPPYYRPSLEFPAKDERRSDRSPSSHGLVRHRGVPARVQRERARPL